MPVAIYTCPSPMPRSLWRQLQLTWAMRYAMGMSATACPVCGDRFVAGRHGIAHCPPKVRA